MSRLSMANSLGPTVHIAADRFAGKRHVRIGIPLPRGWVGDVAALSAAEQDSVGVGGREIALQGRVLARWPDRSIKWLLADLCVLTAAGDRARTEYALIELRQSAQSVTAQPGREQAQRDQCEQ
jgi:hypothetical protein